MNVAGTLGELRTWRPWRRAVPRAAEPGAGLFNSLRLRLTLWYSVVLAMALLACGLVLYLGVEDLTLSPVSASLRSLADFNVQEWQRTPPHRCGEPGGRPPPPGRRQALLPYYTACFDTQGQVIGVLPAGSGQTGAAPEAFLSTSLLAEALRNGTASDVVDDGEDAGPIYRLAVAVHNPRSGALEGVVQVGQSIAPQTETLQSLRNLLLLTAVMALIGSFAIGLILAERALEPARLAFARQQAFIADASHQLRTPLTLLRADAEVLLRHRDHLEPDDAELLDDIVAETAHMDQLATNLLTLARLDAGRLHLEHDVVDLSELAAGLVRRASTLASAKGLAVEEDYTPRMPLIGDRQALEQAALILLENAVKYTPAGGTITLRTRATDGHASLTVEDTGVGIPPEHVKRLGERFYRVDSARSRATGGTGLGLAIAFRIAAAHGGKLLIDSTPGHGTRATLTLPVSGPTR